MDTALSRALSSAIPSAASPGWGLFLLAIVVVVLASLWLSPKVLSAIQKFKYSSPEKDRRAQTTECAAHSERIKALERELRAQRAEIEATKALLSRELRDLRDFIEEKFRQDHIYAQAERLAQEERITAQITNLISLISGRK